MHWNHILVFFVNIRVARLWEIHFDARYMKPAEFVQKAEANGYMTRNQQCKYVYTTNPLWCGYPPYYHILIGQETQDIASLDPEGAIHGINLNNSPEGTFWSDDSRLEDGRCDGSAQRLYQQTPSTWQTMSCKQLRQTAA